VGSRQCGAAQDAFSRQGHQLSEAETLRQLQRENARLRMERDILKKAVAIFPKTEVRYRSSGVIRNYPVAICAAAEVSRSGYYNWLRRPRAPGAKPTGCCP